MTNLSVEITGVKQVVDKLGKADAAKVLRGPMDQALTALELYMKDYPPKPAPISGTAFSPVRFTTKGGKAVTFTALSKGWKRRRGKVVYQGYKRTGKLGQRWSTKIRQSAGGLEGTLTNNLKYAPYVQASARQAWMHKGRWQTDEMAVKRFGSIITAWFKAAIDAALR